MNSSRTVRLDTSPDHICIYPKEMSIMDIRGYILSELTGASVARLQELISNCTVHSFANFKTYGACVYFNLEV